MSERSGTARFVTGLSVIVMVHIPLIKEQSTKHPSTLLQVVLHVWLPLQLTVGCMVLVRPDAGDNSKVLVQEILF